MLYYTYTTTPASLPGSAVINSTVCELGWSPERRYISFVSSCNATTGTNPKELFIWDIAQGSGGYILGIYRSIWQDEKTLLVGAIVTDNITVTVRSLAYNFPDGGSTMFSASAIEEWAVNPRLGNLAIRSIPSLTVVDSMLIPQRPSVGIDVIQGNTLVTSASGPSGCSDLVS